MKLSKENILTRSSSYEILSHFLKPYANGKPLQKGKHISSPFTVDKTPSCNIFPKGNDWFWKDFSSGKGGDCFDLVAELHNLDTKSDFPQILEIINQELSLGLGNGEAVTLPERVQVQAPKVVAPENKPFEINTKDWEESELAYWEKGNVSKDLLQKYHVSVLSSYSSVSNAGKPYTFDNEWQPIFCYHIAKNCKKIYKPHTLDKRFKFQWLGIKPKEYIFGLEQLPPKGKVCFIAAGEKDTLTTVSNGFPAICLNSESAIPSKELLEDLRKRFQIVASLYDNDKTGRTQASKHEEEFGLVNIQLPDFNGKDVFDYVSNGHSLSAALEAQIEKAYSLLPKAKPQISISRKRTYSDYLASMKYFDLPLCEDFSPSGDGGIDIQYLDIKGKPYRITAQRKKIPATRSTLKYQATKAVYLPPALRIHEGELEYLAIVNDEVLAYMLTEAGLPSVGYHQQYSVLPKKGQAVVNTLIRQVLAKVSPKNIIFLQSGSEYKIADAKGNLTKGISASGLNGVFDYALEANAAVKFLTRLEEALTEYKTYVVHLDHYHKTVSSTDNLWLNKYWFELGLSGESIVNMLKESLKGDNDFVAHYLSGRSPYRIKEIFFLNNPQDFYDFYKGIIKGDNFRLGGNVYEIDHEGKAVLSQEGVDELEVVVENGEYREKLGRGGSRRISNFVVEFELEVKGKDSFALASITNKFGQTQQVKLLNSDFRSVDAFRTKIEDLPGKYSYHGTSVRLGQIREIAMLGIEEAVNLDLKLGHYACRYAKKEFFIWGNGLQPYTGAFIPFNEKGLAEYEGIKYYQPAASAYEEEDESYFEYEYKFKLFDTCIEFDDYIKLFIQVFDRNGHTGFSFYLAALYYDFLSKYNNDFPMLFLQGLVGSGKSKLATALGYLFGDLVALNLETNSTKAGFNSHTARAGNALTYINEFNVGSLDKELLLNFKGFFDMEGRMKRDNAKDDRTVRTKIKSAIMIAGQESIYHSEAVNSRCLICEFQKGYYSAEEERAYSKIMNHSKAGISEFTGNFLQLRSFVKENFKPVYRDVKDRLKSGVKLKVLSRLVNNWAIVLTPLILFIQKGIIKYPWTVEEIIHDAITQIEAHHKKISGEGVLSYLFKFIESSYGTGHSNLDHQAVFLVEENDTQYLHVQTTKVLSAFRSFAQRNLRGLQNMSFKDLKTRLQKHESFVGRKASGLQIGYAKDIKGLPILSRPNKTSGFILDYKETGINLPEIYWGEEEVSKQPYF